jgi:hypothetical protein
MTAIASTTRLSPAARLNALGLAVAATGIMIQYVSGVDYPTIPPGPIILLAAASVVVFGPWRRAPVAGLNETLGDPSEPGGFLGALLQTAGLVIALPAGVVAVRSLGSRHG